MAKLFIQYGLLFVALVLAQVVIFNRVCLFNVALPFLFIYFIIRLPLTLSTNLSMTLGFLLGTTIDIFSDTWGMNALACTIISALRMPIIRLYVARNEDLPQAEPSMRSLGVGVYLKYILTVTLIYCFLIFTIEAFSFFNVVQLAMRIMCSTLLTSILILGADSLTIVPREKRL